MTPSTSTSTTRATARRSRPFRVPVMPALVTLGVFGWAAFVFLASASYAHNPPSAAFDLELLLQGGRLVAAGHSPYSPGLLSGQPVEIQSLFYSYPPIVAQLTSLVAGVPTTVVFTAWVAASILSIAGMARVIRDRVAPAVPWLLPVVAAVALAPLWFPYTVGALFGNIDIFFPALYGLMLVAAMADGSRPTDRRIAVVGGIALALASIKLHPALLALWFVLRGVRVVRSRAQDRGSQPADARLPLPWLVLTAAAVTGVAILAISVAVGGVQPWLDYLAVLRASTNVDLLDYRNLGPVAQLVMVLNLGTGAIGPLQAGMLAIGVVATAWAALRVDDPVESFAWASFASFVPMPVTWFHHFGALIPIGLAAALRSQAAGARAQGLTLGLILVAFLIGVFGLGMPVAWLFLPLTILAVRTSRPSHATTATATTAAAVGPLAADPPTTATQPSR